MTRTRCPSPPSQRARGVGRQRRRRVDRRRGGYTPTPVISHAILTYNKGREAGLADGIVITPSHNPPEDGGFKYNPPNGGPADLDITGWIENTDEFLTRKLDQRAHPPPAPASSPTGTYCSHRIVRLFFGISLPFYTVSSKY